jgi:hypothetical protein
MVLVLLVVVLAERVGALVLAQARIDGGRHGGERQEQPKLPRFSRMGKEERSRRSVSVSSGSRESEDKLSDAAAASRQAQG